MRRSGRHLDAVTLARPMLPSPPVLRTHALMLPLRGLRRADFHWYEAQFTRTGGGRL
jgi:hypothetical protein